MAGRVLRPGLNNQFVGWETSSWKDDVERRASSWRQSCILWDVDVHLIMD